MSRPINPTTDPANQATDPGTARAIRALLAVASEDGPPATATDLLRKVHGRAPRRRALMPSLVAVSALGMLAAVAVAASTVTATPPVSAQERVAAAVTRTAQVGYRIHAVISGDKPGDVGTSVYQGVFDPARQAVRMVVVTPDTGHVTIHLDGKVYIQIPGRQPGVPKNARWWLRSGGYSDRDGISELAEFGHRALLSPQQALEFARSAGDVREVEPVSGDGWTGTRFAFTLTDRNWRVTGNVDVDGDGRVRRLEYTSTATDTARGLTGTIHGVLTFRDFGTQERVALPPDSQVWRGPKLQGPAKLARDRRG